MAAQMLPAKPQPGMLALAGRNFYGFKLWRIACASGATLAWRFKSNLKLVIQQMLPDGSYLSNVFDGIDKHRTAGQIVRVIDYTLQDSPPRCRTATGLVTNILDPMEAPALELAALYHESWEIEGRLRRIQDASARPTALCCAARHPSWCCKSCGGCCWRTSPSDS